MLGTELDRYAVPGPTRAEIGLVDEWEMNIPAVPAGK